MKKIVLLILLTLFVYTNKVFCTFQFAYDINPGVSSGSIALGDIDNDGDLDLVVVGSYTSKVYANDGNGSFAFYSDISPGVISCSIALGDIDNDGDLDLLLAGYSNVSGRISKTYKNDGNGNFIFSSDISPGVSESSIALGDIDNDGDLDLLLTGYSGGATIRISKLYKNNGDGDFIFSADLSVSISGGSTAFADIDNDDDLDLFITGWQGSIRIAKCFTNNGNGDFNAKFDINPGVDNSSFSIGDINNNNYLDIILTGFYWDGSPHGVFKSYTNDKYGNFDFKTDIGPSIYFGCTALGDIFNNGNLDLVGTGNNRFKIYENDGSGNFAFKADISPGVSESSVALGDIDNDGDLDAIVAGIASSNILKIYINTNLKINLAPSSPSNLIAYPVNNYWKFQWDNSTDDNTSSNLLRYHIAIGTNSSGNYDYISDIIAYPNGQANFGNVLNSINFQSKIPYPIKCYWKVKAIDTAFKSSDYSIESIADLPSEPTELKGVAFSTNLILWIWNDNELNEINYAIYNTESSNISGLLDSNSINWIQSNLSPNRAYSNYAVVFSLSGSNKSLTSKCYTLANSPKRLEIISVISNDIILSWTNGKGGNTRYAIERAEDTNGSPTNWNYIIQWDDNLATTIYVDNNLASETKYWYRVSGYNNDGIITLPSNETNVTTLLPNVPNNINGWVLSANQILWQWIDISTVETNYIVFNHQNSNISGLLETNASIWTQKNLFPNTWYTNYAYVFNEYGGLKSNEDSACTYAIPPKSLNGKAIDGNTISLTWVNVNATAYCIERANDINGSPDNWQAVVNFSKKLSLTSYIDNNLTPNTYYWYRIKSYNKQGVINPQPSNEVKIKTDIAGNLENVVAVPNPYKATASEQYLTFFNITKNVSIKVYTVDGRLLAKIQDDSGKGFYDWDLTDAAGEYLDSGVYICHLSNDEGQKRIIKIVIIQ